MKNKETDSNRDYEDDFFDDCPICQEMKNSNMIPVDLGLDFDAQASELSFKTSVFQSDGDMDWAALFKNK